MRQCNKDPKSIKKQSKVTYLRVLFCSSYACMLSATEHSKNSIVKAFKEEVFQIASYQRSPLVEHIAFHHCSEEAAYTGFILLDLLSRHPWSRSAKEGKSRVSASLHLGGNFSTTTQM